MLRIFLLSILCLGSIHLAAQEYTIKGTVKDKRTGGTLPGVTVREKGTRNGTSTGPKGTFTLKVENDTATLVFSFIGFKTVEEPVDGREGMTVLLPHTTEELEEVVVTALGIKRERDQLGYSVQKIESKEVTRVREPNLVNSLAGNVAGVQTTNGASGPGSSSRIVIRGETSLSGNDQPLFVVDGIPIRNRMIPNAVENDESGFQEVDYGNGAGELSSDDIRSISVLKGPGAAALYGARAANGVVLIETKDGSRSGEGVGVSIHSSLTFQTPLTFPQFQNKYGQGSGGEFKYEDGNGGGVNDGGITSFGPKLDGRRITQFDGPSTTPDGTPVRGGDVIARQGEPITPTSWEPHPDNVRNFFRTGMTNMNNIAVSAGDIASSFRLSFSNMKDQGMIPNVDLNRNGVAFSGRHQFDEHFSARAYLNYIRTSSSHRPALGYGSENPMYLFTWMGRQVDVGALEDYWQHGQEGAHQFNYNYKWMDNPYLAVHENTNSFVKHRFLGNIDLSYSFNDRWSVRLKSGMDRFNDLRRSKRAFSTQRFRHGAYREDDIDLQEINTDLRVTYDEKVGRDIDLSLAVGGNVMDRRTSYKAITAEELSVPGVYNFENARTALVGQQRRANKRINSLYGILRAGYRNKVHLDLTYRTDQSSTLPEKNNTYGYYSGSMSIVLSRMMDLPDMVDMWRMRVSGASVGSDTDPYQLRNSFVYAQRYGSQPLVTSSFTYHDPRLRPERTNALEIGTELWLWRNRIGMDASVYQNTATDQIIDLPTSSASGYTSRTVNGGTIRSRGVEAILYLTPIQKENTRWTATFNFSRNVSKVTELPKGVDRYVTGHSSVYASAENTVYYIATTADGGEGGRVGDMYGTGFKKVNGEVVHDQNGLPVRSPELRLLGNYNPDFILGFGNTFEYENFSFDFLWDWRQGGVVVSRMRSIGSTSGVLEGTLEGREEGIVGDGVTNTGTAEDPEYVENTTEVSAEEYYNQFYNRANEEPAVYDASYLKLREVRIGYDLPEKWIEGVGFGKVTVSLIGRNLLLFTENPHFDPELNTMQGQNMAYGVEDMAYPSPRSYGMSIKVDL